MKKLKIKYLDAIPILIIAFLLCKLVFTADMSLSGALGVVYSCVSYFVYGLIIAYLLNPIISTIESRVVNEGDSARKRKVKRGFTIAVVYLAVLGLLAVFFVNIIPEIASGLKDFFANFTEYLAAFQTWLKSTFRFISPNIMSKMTEFISSLGSNFTNWMSNRENIAEVSGVVTDVVSVSAKFVLNLVFGVVISVYFIYGKENILKQIKRLVYAVFSETRAENIVNRSNQINKIFHDFILSKLVQAFVMFVFGLVVLVPLGIPYAPLISLVLAISNMIPYLGPWLGSVPCVLLVLLTDPSHPIQALILVAFILIMQIVDNVYIGPKITADRVGISPLLVIAGVAIGGTFGGVIGMFLGVPVVAVIKLVFYDSFVERRLKEKNIDI